MIAKLRGLLDGFSADHAVIDVGGVGYLVFASSRTLSALGGIGGGVSRLLAAAGHDLRGYDLSEEALSSFAAKIAVGGSGRSSRRFAPTMPDSNEKPP